LDPDFLVQAQVFRQVHNNFTVNIEGQIVARKLKPKFDFKGKSISYLLKEALGVKTSLF